MSVKTAIGPTKGKGLGIFSVYPCERGDVLEVSPVIPLREATHVPELDDHVLKHKDGEAVGLGFLMLYNHSNKPNARMYGEGTWRVVSALRKIRAGEEITVKYKCKPWFKVLP